MQVINANMRGSRLCSDLAHLNVWDEYLSSAPVGHASSIRQTASQLSASDAGHLVAKALVNDSALALVADKTFKCTECGKCCTGAGEVWINEAECDKIAEHLVLDIDTFKQSYCKSYDKIAGWHALKYKPGPDKVCLLQQLHLTNSASACTYPQHFPLSAHRTVFS